MMQPAPVSPSPDSDRPGFSYARWPTLVVAAVAIVLVEIATWFLVRSQGNVISGDSPNYLIAAQALSHLTVHVLPAFSADLRSHYVFAWPLGATVETMGAHVYFGPHGAIFAQGIGIPALLAPFVALGSVPLALVAFFSLNAVGFVYIHQRASRLARLGRPAQLAFALAMAAPAIWLAATQVYPDLLSGIFLACAFVELALAEQSRHLGTQGAVVVSIALAVAPWLQIKNMAVVVIMLLAFGVLLLRRQLLLRPVAIVAGVALASFVLLLIYNQFYFGHVLGLPQPNPNFGIKGVRDTLALIFDRDQGFLVQCPTILLGLIGIWLSRRTIAVTNIALVLGCGAILVINGTQPIVGAFGGVAFAGRFEWTVMPMLLAWSALFFKRLGSRSVRLAVLSAVIGFLWVVQAVPILIDDHSYFNATYLPFAPWDPTLYPGWWTWFTTYLPVFTEPPRRLWSYFAGEIVLFGALTALLLRLTKKRRLRLLPFLGAGAVLVVVAILVTSLGATDQLPVGPASWTGADLGSPWRAGTTTAYTSPAPVSLVNGGAGTYRATVDLRTSGSGTSGSGSVRISFLTTPIKPLVVTQWFSLRHPTSATTMTVSVAPFSVVGDHVSTLVLPRPGSRPGEAVLHHTFSLSAPSVIWVTVSLSPGTTLSVTALQLQKLAP